MYNIVARVMANLTKEQVNDFALSKDINLGSDELDFVYDFIKKNWEQIFNNPKLLKIERYKNHFSAENFQKINKLVIEYTNRYGSYLK